MTATNDHRRVQSIIIVGGGSSGWITANLLNARLNINASKNVKITLIESPDIPAIGVGEATVPSIRRTLKAIGISEADFMRRTDATFKSLIRFEDWNLGEHFDHPFDRRSRPDTDVDVQSWLSKNHSGGKHFANTFSILSNTSTRLRAPKALGWPEYQSTFPYAYHLDAAKLGHLLADFGTQNGIHRVLTKIETAKISDAGDIEKLVDLHGNDFTADLYIDCTGFSARLSAKVSPETQDYSSHLICNSAATMSIPYEEHRPEHILPYTSAKALKAGWLWDINMQSRRSLGYVYASGHIQSEDVDAELRAVEGSHSQDIPIKHIKFRTYKRTKTWHGNCIAIGLSDGFVEPLESTGLYMMQFAAQSVAELLFYNTVYSRHTAKQFNGLMQSLFDEIIGYVALHYVTSTRRDTPFWRDATKPERLPDHLAHLFEEWKGRPPHDMDLLANHRLFSLESYEYLLFGMGHVNVSNLDAKVSQFNLSDALEKCYSKLPLHEDWLSKSLR